MQSTIRKLLFPLLLAGCLSGAVACTGKEGSERPREGVTLRISTASTRANVYPEYARERAVDHVDWLVWDGNDDLVAHQRTTEGTCELEISSGTYTFVAVVNLPYVIDDGDIATVDDYLENVTVSYADCHLDPLYELSAQCLDEGSDLEPDFDHLYDGTVFVMRSGLTELSVSGGDEVTLSVCRVADRIVLDYEIEYTDGFVALYGEEYTDSPHGSGESVPGHNEWHNVYYEVYGWFLVNVPSTVSVGDGSISGGSYEYDNHSGFSLNSWYDMISEWDGSALTAPFPSWFFPVVNCWDYDCLPQSGVLYCFPNGADETDDVMVEDNQTKLVLWTATGFYVIPLPRLGMNESYYITDIIISGPGSQRPMTVYDSGAIRFSITSLTPWSHTSEDDINADIYEYDF